MKQRGLQLLLKPHPVYPHIWGNRKTFQTFLQKREEVVKLVFEKNYKASSLTTWGVPCWPLGIFLFLTLSCKGVSLPFRCRSPVRRGRSLSFASVQLGSGRAGLQTQLRPRLCPHASRCALLSTTASGCKSLHFSLSLAFLLSGGGGSGPTLPPSLVVSGSRMK